MINTKLHKATYELAEKLMQADSQGKQKTFDELYTQLKALCEDNEKTEIDHPEQWETLADFTADYDEALVLYEKALGKAIAINNKEYMSSIMVAIAKIHIDLQQTYLAVKQLENAKVSANKIADKELKKEIADLLANYL